VNVPRYQGIVVGASLLNVLAALCAIFATALIGFCIADTFGRTNPFFTSSQTSAALTASLVMYGYAAMLAMLESIGRAIRDIARNSFKR
jgi:hypothetical protein